MRRPNFPRRSSGDGNRHSIARSHLAIYVPAWVDGGSSPRGVTCAAHVFTAHVRADPGLVWTALTDSGQSAAYLYGLAAHSTWAPGDPVELRLGDRVELTGRVLCVRDRERLSYLLRSGPGDPPGY